MATAMLKWKNKKLQVNSAQIYPLSDFSASVKIKEKKSSSKKKNTELEELEFTAVCNANTGADPQEEYESWCGKIKKSGILYLHGKAWSTTPFILQSVSLDGVITDDYGRIRYAELKLKFKEKNKKEKSEKKAAKAAASEASKAQRKNAKQKGNQITFRAGSKVRITGNYWADGTKVDPSMKKKNVTIQKISGAKSYIAEGAAWIYTNVLTLVE